MGDHNIKMDVSKIDNELIKRKFDEVDRRLSMARSARQTLALRIKGLEGRINELEEDASNS